MCFKINTVKAIRKDKGINLGAIPKDLNTILKIYSNWIAIIND